MGPHAPRSRRFFLKPISLLDRVDLRSVGLNSDDGVALERKWCTDEETVTPIARAVDRMGSDSRMIRAPERFRRERAGLRELADHVFY